MHPRFQTAFAQLADNLQSALEPILADKYFPALLTGEQVSSLKSATGLDEDALAFALLPLAAEKARAMREGYATPATPAFRTNTPITLPIRLMMLDATDKYIVTLVLPMLRNSAAPAL